jgi:hypothetical protein
MSKTRISAHMRKKYAKYKAERLKEIYSNIY